MFQTSACFATMRRSAPAVSVHRRRITVSASSRPATESEKVS